MEIEFKFRVPSARLKALQSDMAAGGASQTRMQARYFDTAGGALSKHGVVLRLRQENARVVQTTKANLADKGPLHQLEHNFQLPAKEDAASALPDVRRHAGTGAGKLLEKIRKHDDAPLVETFSSDIVRLACIEQLGTTKVEVALDVGTVRCKAPEEAGASYRESSVCELELELVEGEVADLVALAARWSQRHGLSLSSLSKAERGERLRSGKPVKAVKAVPPDFSAMQREALTGRVIQRTVLRACLAQVLPNASEVAAGNESAETVHQLRVGLRRLRTALRELDRLASPAPKAKHAGQATPQPTDFDPAWAPVLTEAFRVLGTHRDRHLLEEDLQPRLVQAGAPSIHMEEPAAAASTVGDAVRAPAFQDTLVALIGFTSTPAKKSSSDDSDDPDASLRVLRSRLGKLFRQIVRDGKRFDQLTATGQHRVRKRLKRLRYLAEFTGDLFGDKATARFVAHLVPAQDALGALNDEAVALARYRQAAATDPGAWFAVGWLSAEHAGKVQACCEALVGLAEVSPFWKKH
jgi:triphosphatase